MQSTATHGGAFWDSVGDDIERLGTIVAADVLDAWFDPAPGVLRIFREYLPLISRTSPPARNSNLIRKIAAVRGLPEESIVVGPGSSALIFLGLRTWVSRGQRALVLDPTYGEYEHVLTSLLDCEVRKFPLDKDNQYDVDLGSLRDAASASDLLVLVNPNSPTGRHISTMRLLPFLEEIAQKTTVWIDETYVEYAGPGESLEWLAATHPNVIVCKSMSKAYGLSGLRAAYLACHPSRASEIQRWSPPWTVSLAGELAAIEALADPGYYETRYNQTHDLRADLVAALQAFEGVEVTAGIINCVLLHLPADGPSAQALVNACQARGVFLRDTASMGTTMGDRTVRIAVRDRDSNLRVVRTLGACLYPTLARLR